MNSALPNPRTSRRILAAALLALALGVSVRAVAGPGSSHKDGDGFPTSTRQQDPSNSHEPDGDRETADRATDPGLAQDDDRPDHATSQEHAGPPPTAATPAGRGSRSGQQPTEPGTPRHARTEETGPATSDEPPSSKPATLEACRERYVIAPGVEEEVRRRVPEQFELRYNSNGQPLLYITAIHCQRYTANGVTRETTAAAFGVSIESPDGVVCARNWPVVGAVQPEAAGSCNNYLVWAAYDNPAVVAWARVGTPDAPVHLVNNLSFEEEPFDPVNLGMPLRFDSGSTPSGYRLDLVVRERPLTLPLSAAFWFESRAGTVRIGFETDAIALGEASGQLTADPGSEMARMLGTETPAAQQPFPLVAGNRWNHGTLTKTVLAPTSTGARRS